MVICTRPLVGTFSTDLSGLWTGLVTKGGGGCTWLLVSLGKRLRSAALYLQSLSLGWHSIAPTGVPGAGPRLVERGAGYPKLALL